MSTTSKQDRQGSRTPADLERKYDLGAMGDRFAEIMGIATDAQMHSEAALDAVELTNSVVADLSQKVDEISITVKDLDEGTLAALSVEVGKISLSVEGLNKNINSAEFVIGVINGTSTAKISANRLDIVGEKLNIKVDATNIMGKLTAAQINVTDLSALNATIGGWEIEDNCLSHEWTDQQEPFSFNYKSYFSPIRLYFSCDILDDQRLSKSMKLTLGASGIAWDFNNDLAENTRQTIMEFNGPNKKYIVYPDITTGTLKIIES